MNCDPILAARMIMGCCYYENKLTKYKKIANCLITLLNGKLIDVDKLDYIARDKWASGYSASSVDISRLVSAIVIIEKKREYKVCFHKSALSELESVFEAKKFQNIWIFSHHKVIYDQYLLKKSVEKLSEIITKHTKDTALSEIFTAECFLRRKKSIMKLFLCPVMMIYYT